MRLTPAMELLGMSGTGAGAPSGADCTRGTPSGGSSPADAASAGLCCPEERRRIRCHGAAPVPLMPRSSMAGVRRMANCAGPPGRA